MLDLSRLSIEPEGYRGKAQAEWFIQEVPAPIRHLAFDELERFWDGQHVLTDEGKGVEWAELTYGSYVFVVKETRWPSRLDWKLSSEGKPLPLRFQCISFGSGPAEDRPPRLIFQVEGEDKPRVIEIVIPCFNRLSDEHEALIDRFYGGD